MSRDLPWGRIAYVFFGYLAAVLVAVAVAVFAMLAPTMFPDDGAWGSFYAYRRDLIDVFQIGLVFTFPTALPGFLLTLFLARWGGWVGWLPYACAGLLNAVLALAIFDLALQMFDPTPLRMPLLPLDLLLPCLPGGFAGGVAYWVVVRKSLRDRAAFP